MKRTAAIIGSVLVLGLVSYGARPAETGYRVIEITQGGSIAGTVTFDGAVPEIPMLDVTKNPDVCGETIADPNATVVNGENKGVRWALVYLEEVSEGKAPSEQVVLDNEGCAFHPHVMGAVEGQPFVIENSDPVLHNTHIRYGRTLQRARRTVFNGALSFHEGEPQYRPIDSPRVLRRPGWIDIQCDAHEWMQGYGLVLEHPYFAVTDASGGFEITDVPPGTYTLKLWHENLGEHTQEVTVEAGASATANFALAP